MFLHSLVTIRSLRCNESAFGCLRNLLHDPTQGRNSSIQGDTTATCSVHVCDIFQGSSSLSSTFWNLKTALANIFCTTCLLMWRQPTLSLKQLIHSQISQDSQVQGKWSSMGSADIPRLIKHVKIENLELQTDVFPLSLPPPPPPHLPLRCSRLASSSAPVPTWCTSSGRRPSWSTSSTSSMLLASMRADRTCSRCC